MSTFAEIRDGFKAAVVAASGRPAGTVCWERSQNPVADPILRLSLVSDVEDTPLRVDYTPSGDDLERTISQQRTFTFQVAAETVNDFHAADAMAVLVHTRTALWTLTARAEIVGALLHDFTSIRPHHYHVGGRLVHAWSFDAQVRAAIDLVDPTPQGTIETVIVGQTLADVDATDIPLGDIEVSRP